MNSKVEFDLPNGKRVMGMSEADNEFEDFEVINKSLKWVREELKKLLFTTNRNPVEYGVYIYIDKEINALAKKDNSGYVIALSSAIFTSLSIELKEYFYQKDIRDYFYGNKKTADFHMKEVMKYCLLFICFHEYYHILNGHCDYNKASVCFFELVSVKKNYQYNEKQIMEYDADYCAVRSIMYLILNKYKKRYNRSMECVKFGFALYFLFLKFQEQAYESFECGIMNLWETSHPYSSIRMAYSISVMTYCYNTFGVDLSEVVSDIKKIAELGIYFDRVYYDADSLKLSLLALAYTEKGMGHIAELTKGWSLLKKKLKKNAYIELRDSEKIRVTDIQKGSWVTENGDFMNKYDGKIPIPLSTPYLAANNLLMNELL